MLPVCRFTLLGLLIALFASPGSVQAEDARNEQPDAAMCIECLRIRVGVPFVVQGPAPNIADNTFSEIRLANGTFRGFTAGGETFAIDGRTSVAMNGPLRKVLSRGAPRSYGASGKWINHVERAGAALLAWVHNETGDAPGQGLMSMSLAVSNDDGLSWNDIGQIITGKEGLIPGRVTGEGGCTAVNGTDGYYYAYCWRNRSAMQEAAHIVARAPVTDPGPGHWMKYYQGRWDQPGLGGNSTGLANGTGGEVARWRRTGQTLLLGWTRDGMGLAFSHDRLNFTSLGEPLLKLDTGRWDRKGPPNELLAYQTLIDAETGENQLGDQWLLTYMYLQPNEGFDKRYLVLRRIEISRSRRPEERQVGVMLADWYSARLHEHWSTLAPVPENYSEYKLVAQSGYLMTVADPKHPTVELEDCVSQQGQHHDHILMAKIDACESHGYQRLRSVGWVFSTPQLNTLPLYRCYSEAEQSHFAANSEDCDHAGNMDALLGYVLKQ